MSKTPFVINLILLTVLYIILIAICASSLNFLMIAFTVMVTPLFVYMAKLDILTLMNR